MKLDGHTFQGHSDTEVVLHAYAQWGESCVERFNGIFAFAVWEEESERLFLARDRIGVKPLFYTLREGRFFFASELKTLLAHPAVPAQVDAQGVAEIMLLGPGRTPGCGVFRGIREVEPGCCGYFDGKKFACGGIGAWKTGSIGIPFPKRWSMSVPSLQMPSGASWSPMCRCAPFFPVGWIPV